jgi:hypothetical protein
MKTVTLVLAVLMTSVLSTPRVEAEATAPTGCRGAAFTFAKSAIKSALKNPHSADFDWESVKYRRTIRLRSKETGAESAVVCVGGVVRATNSFGAVVPSEWVMWMHHKDEQYTPIIAMLDDQIVMKTKLGEKVEEMLIKAQAAKEEKDRVKVEAAAKVEMAVAAGRASGEEAAKKYSRNAADKIIEQNARKAATKADLATDEEVEHFVSGFVEAAQAAIAK